MASSSPPPRNSHCGRPWHIEAPHARTIARRRSKLPPSIRDHRCTSRHFQAERRDSRALQVVPDSPDSASSHGNISSSKGSLVLLAGAVDAQDLLLPNSAFVRVHGHVHCRASRILNEAQEFRTVGNQTQPAAAPDSDLRPTPTAPALLRTSTRLALHSAQAAAPTSHECSETAIGERQDAAVRPLRESARTLFMLPASTAAQDPSSVSPLPPREGSLERPGRGAPSGLRDRIPSLAHVSEGCSIAIVVMPPAGVPKHRGLGALQLALLRQALPVGKSIQEGRQAPLAANLRCLAAASLHHDSPGMQPWLDH